MRGGRQGWQHGKCDSPVCGFGGCKRLGGNPGSSIEQCAKNSKDSDQKMSKSGPMKSLPGWVSQKRSQVQEGKNSPVAAPGENMEFQERDAGSIGAIQPPMASIAYEHHLTPREDGFLWGQSSLTLPFSLEHPRVFGEHNHLTGHHLRCLVIISGGYHLGQGSTTSGPGANSSPLPVFQIKFYWHRATPICLHTEYGFSHTPNNRSEQSHKAKNII